MSKTGTKLTLHMALLQLQQLNVAIRLTPRSVAIWTPNKRVPGALRAIVKEHNAEIREMIQQCHIDVCPSSTLHRPEWYYAGPEWTVDAATCAICERLAVISEVPNRSNFDKIKVKDKMLFDTLSLK